MLTTERSFYVISVCIARVLYWPIQILPVLSKIEPGSHSHLYDPCVLTHSPLKQASGPSSLHSSMSSHMKFLGFSWVPVGQMHWKLPGVFRHWPPLQTCMIDLTIHNGNGLETYFRAKRSHVTKISEFQFNSNISLRHTHIVYYYH